MFPDLERYYMLIFVYANFWQMERIQALNENFVVNGVQFQKTDAMAFFKDNRFIIGQIVWPTSSETSVRVYFYSPFINEEKNQLAVQSKCLSTIEDGEERLFKNN